MKTRKIVDRSSPPKECVCGCGQMVVVRWFHRYSGTPRFIFGHYGKIPLRPEYRKAFSKLWLGKKRSPESRKKSGDSRRGLSRSIETRIKISLSKIGAKASSEAREKMSSSQLGRRHSDKTKLMMSNSALRHNGGVEKRIKTNIARYGRPLGRVRDTKIESEMRRVLDGIGVKYEAQVWFCSSAVDFILHEHLLVVEADGCYWHGCQKCFPGSVSKKADKEISDGEKIKAKGYRLLRVWEHDLSRFRDIIEPALAGRHPVGAK